MERIVESDELVADYEVFRVRRLTAHTFTFHVIDRPGTVEVIAITDDDQVVMVEQFRYGARSVELEFPAGIVDEGEEPVHTALRELEEETGYRAAHHEIVGEMFSDPALNTNVVTIVAAYGCTRTGRRHLDESEDVTVRLFPRAEVNRMIARGEIRHGLAIAAWHLFGSR
jgi:ADP-ribose pyrophosphatase